jgi:serine/threonine protein kinase
MLGRYALYEKIASGGMASVHIGRLLGPVGFTRTVAIKRMHPQFAGDPEFVSMFLDEARLAARVRHPNVVPTLDVVAMSGELFLVMEYVQGESLHRLSRAAAARGERIPTEMVVTMMVGALHGLHAAHEAKNDRGEPLGIVHRDVTPHNVLVGTDGVARVLDFGVAKAAGRVATTREGHLKGKMAYMSPEQVRGSVTRATDVYAAAVVLWEMLTGRRLFEGDNDVQVLEKVLRGCDVPPSKHVPGLPAALDAATMRGLNPDPAARFATAREMARCLEDAVQLVAASKIGDWVEAAAEESLHERSAKIALIESDTAVHVLRVPTPPAISPDESAQSRRLAAEAPELVLAGRPSQPMVPIVTDDGMPTQMSSGSISAPRRVARLRSTRLAWMAGGGVAACAIATSVVVSLSSGPKASGGAAASPPPSQTAEVTPAAPAESSGPSPQAIAAASALLAVPQPATSASASADRSGVSGLLGDTPKPPGDTPKAAGPSGPARPPPAPAVVHHPSTPPAGGGVAAPPKAAGCNPPWYFDRRGVRVFRPECL